MAGSLWGKLFYSSSSSSSGSAAKTDRRRGGQKKTGLSLSLTGSRHPQPISWSDIPVAVLAQALRCLPFQVSTFAAGRIHDSASCTTQHSLTTTTTPLLPSSMQQHPFHNHTTHRSDAGVLPCAPTGAP